MSKFKKVISLVLCFAMLAGTFAFLGDLIAPAASAAVGTTNVAKYADLDKEYDKFVYVGIDVIEVANGELTDGYVNAGDWLEYRMTVLSDMYVGASAPHIVYEKDFFDIRVVTSTTPAAAGSTTYEANVKLVDGTLMNPDHPYAAPNVATYHTITALPSSKVATQLGFCEIDADTYANWDLVKSAIGITSTEWNHNFPMTTDTWWTNWYVRVQEGLADGETGNSFSPEAIWKHKLNPSTGKGDSRRLGDVATADTEGTAASAKALNLRYDVVKHVLLDDTYHTFTIGTNPADVEAPVETKPVIFQNVDGTVILAADYAEGDTIVIPEVENLIGWADSTGKLVEINTTMGQRALTYTAVLSTDKFDVKINLDGGAFAEDAVLPEGAEKNDDGSVTVKAAFGEEYDLTALPLPVKPGYTAAWEPATVKVESTKGATAKVKWNADTFTAKFYLDKAAYEAGEAALKTFDIEYKKTLNYGSAAELAAMKTEYKFAGWINAATGEKVSSSVAIGAYNFTEDTEFYGDWTEYNSTVTVWGRDYANGGWKVLTTKYADAGTVLKINELKALVTEENYGTAAQYVVAGPENTFNTNTAIRTDITMAEGNKDVYLFTNIKFSITLKTPEVDENGYIIDSYVEAPMTVTSDMEKEDALTIANPLINAPKADAYPGYTFVGWEDEEGNVYPAGNIALDAANGTEYTFTAKFEETVYTVEFVVNYDSALKEVILAEETFTIGDTLDVSAMTLVKEAAKTAEDEEANGDDTTTDENGDATTGENGDATTDENGDATTDENGDATTGENGDETTGENGDAEEVPEEEDKVTYVPAILPEIGKENREQAGGPYRNVDGYQFVGWKTGTQSDKFVDFNVDETFELTPNKIKELTFNQTIIIKGFWEGLYYDFIAHYATEIGADGKPVYLEMPAVQIQTGASLDAAYAAALEKVNEKLPEGRRFSIWRLENGSTKPSNMPAYGVEVYAYYLGRSLSVYIDYNYGTADAPVELTESMIKSGQYSKLLFDGVDVENDIPEGELQSIANMIRMSTVSETNSPGTNYEVVGWKIYYVKSDNEEDIYNKANWVEGISDIEGSTIAKYNLVFQVEWMAHSDFLFRVYNTDGALRSALDKKFQKHFWYMNKPVDKENAEPLNALPERLIIIGFLPKFEFENGFAIRIDPISISKAWLNPANWGALLEALFNGLSTGFGGAI